MKLNFSKPTKFEWIALCFFLACVALMSYAFYSVSRALRWQSLKPGMYREVHADIIDPLESKHNITDKEWKYRDCSRWEGSPGRSASWRNRKGRCLA